MAQNHSMILTGGDTDLLLSEARAVAASLNCANTDDKGVACGVCACCRRIEEGNSPNWFTVWPQGKARLIQIEQIRELISGLMSKPEEGRFKVVALVDAHRMREEAQNALLKTLEEPPEDALILLLTSKPNDLFPTVRSRCVIRDLSSGPPVVARTDIELVEMVSRSIRERGYPAVFEQAAFIAGRPKSSLPAFISALEYLLRSKMLESARDPSLSADSAVYIDALRRVWQAGYLLERNVNATLILENLFLYIRRLSV